MSGNPAHESIFNITDIIPSIHQIPLRGRVLPLLQATAVDVESIDRESSTRHAPWTLRFPEINFKLTALKKGETNSEEYLSEFALVMQKYRS